MKFKIKTPNNELVIECFCSFIEKEKVKINLEVFNKMCKEGCVNYAKKFSCPPFAPSFEKLVEDKEGLFVVLFKCNLKEIDSTEYNKVRIANVVMKSKIEKLMRFLEKKFQTIYLSTGSCRLCKPCKLKIKEPCKYPEKKRYSLEAVGLDCDKLSQDLFGFPLLWYKDKRSPEYTCVICGLVCDKKDVKELMKDLKRHLPLLK